MSTLEVCLTPELIHLHEVEGKTVVVTDIFRATSSMVSGLATNVSKIKPVSKVSDSEEWHKKGFLRAGERNGVKIPGFELGNSPFDFMEVSSGSELVMTTTNGTKAIAAAAEASQIVIGAFLNLGTVVNYLKINNSKELLVICAGWKGRLSMEDTLFAGALCHLLGDHFKIENDEAYAALALYEKAKNDLYGFLKNAGHAQRLRGLNFEKDIRFCLECNRFDNLTVIDKGFIVNA